MYFVSEFFNPAQISEIKIFGNNVFSSTMVGAEKYEYDEVDGVEKNDGACGVKGY